MHSGSTPSFLFNSTLQQSSFKLKPGAKRKKGFDDNETFRGSIKRERLNRLVASKEVEHKCATQETQLVYISSKNSKDDHSVDLKKIVEIRRTLRRRYFSRSDYRTIFNQWDMQSLGVIRLEDVHEMVNRLGIKTNINEAQVIVACSDKTGSGTLNMNDFIHMIIDGDDAVEIDQNLMQIRAKEPKYHCQNSLLIDLSELALN